MVLYSEPGTGTSVKVHLPVSPQAPQGRQEAVDRAPGGHGETVLVVEDEPEVRRITERILASSGYEVLSAAGGDEALEIFARRPVDLVLTDVIMPGMVGPDLVARMRESEPTLRVIFMSGYAHQVLAPESLRDERHTAFLEKPFPADRLRQAVRDLLDGAAS